MNEWITVARTEEVGPGERRVIDVDDTQIIVFNLAGQYYAIEDVCTHDGGQLTGGTVEGDQIVCPRHGARFCIRTGAALSAPAYDPTRTFPVRIENSEIQVRDDRWD
ncbi:non-heme iron oxygenase ferredoxin subunit [Pseudomonas sp. MH9.2]|uniref:Rieske (2Fe-2S) protein n=1 Tax=unclassified Pseudomonas TaxID=196821 RepID=UPI002AC89C4A|nr:MULTISPECIES: non-heme iron oxygenase ferredoxin subunit [unclassified Pseudomonas]MEB0027347.1 non-heme iron oxygenase ferredoxin subunit [Pseudomonas sp. MH9.2]MEB0150242.1 non-heme iron oxygenase ferredoxin subunit [Pseudomonas sp. CCC2.2]MEE3507482.1 non-heme iron oxygenase ferredoxin subunit [Pseudomonas sp. 10C3]WPX68844.1 non-heme iron oxygenase ferredoxin subunit [Pseudomonas sp. MH9.2]